MLNNKTILITGGTGSFGKAFAASILKQYSKVKKIIIYSRDEFKQFEMANLPDFKDNSKMRFFIGDVRDKDRLYRAFDGVDIVVHAAALKQIPSCEYNPFEAIKTNIYGAQNVIDCAIDKNVEKVIALSTDKACAPVNLYGATKLCSDKLFIAANAYSGEHKTRFSVVRYGNVAGSRGSVIPYFKSLIKSNAKYLPITDPKMTRFWLELKDAVDLVLLALDRMTGGEIFVKKISSIKITDLAASIAPNLPTKIVGIRPGEKIHEIMITKEDARNTIELKNYYIILPDNKFLAAGKHRLKGKPVSEDFEYHSGNNKEWLSVKQIRKLLQEVQWS